MSIEQATAATRPASHREERTVVAGDEVLSPPVLEDEPEPEVPVDSPAELSSDW